MLKYQRSIRQKIVLGYYAIAAVMVGISIFAFVELRFLEKKIVFGDVISEFFDTTLEIRRFEKNYFLYREENDYRENVRYLTRAADLLESNVLGFNIIAGPKRTARLRGDLKSYRELIDLYAGKAGASALEVTALEGRIREKGKDIVGMAESISRTERLYLQGVLNNSQNVILFSIALLSVLAVGVGQVLSRMIVKPLKLIQREMEKIAEGRFDTLQIDSGDREIVSLTNAFSKMLKELEMRQRHLVQSEKLASLGTLLSGVAHELNNPLSNISTSCQILTEEIDEADLEYRKELLGQIEEQTDRARGIVLSLLDFSRDSRFRKETLPLRKVLEETIRFLRGQIPAKVGIVLDIPEEIRIDADKQRIQRVFLNLIKNAAESIGAEGTISVKARISNGKGLTGEDKAGTDLHAKYSGRCSFDEDTVDISVSDTGSGIPGELLPKIFDPFFTTRDVGKGSGLGLFIVHEIIEEHGGCVTVDSTEGQGTTFLIRLPLRSDSPGKGQDV